MTYQRATPDISWLLHSFNSISLDELNNKAEMLSRIDNKYIIRGDRLQQVIAEVADQFDILDIDDCRAFTYDTRYFDDPERSAYYEHHQGLRKGFKVRVRSYADAALCFLEVKVKGTRGMTVKHRLPYDPAQREALSGEAFDFIRSTYSEQYDKPFDYDLKRALDLRYKRITLVAKAGGERMTIDTALQFWSGDKTVKLSSDLFIVETKSALGRGIADLSFRKVHERPTPRCSKYCVGMAALGEVSKWNRFMPTLRKLDLVEGMQMIPTRQQLQAA